eukprot:2341585-Ditylum_brightwellii.AAC.1
MKRVDYSCMGKCMGMGMVLCNQELMDDIGKNSLGETTVTSYNIPAKTLEEVISLFGNVPG